MSLVEGTVTSSYGKAVTILDFVDHFTRLRSTVYRPLTAMC